MGARRNNLFIVYWHIMYKNMLDVHSLGWYTQSISPAKRICIVEKSAACYGKAAARLRFFVPKRLKRVTL
jgi:hypothetical protein